jgi:hypothetical protein
MTRIEVTRIEVLVQYPFGWRWLISTNSDRNRAGQALIEIEKKQEIHRIAQGKFPSKSRRSNKSNEASRLLLSGALRAFRSCRSVM